MRRAIGKKLGSSRAPKLSDFSINFETIKKKNQARHFLYYDNFAYKNLSPHYRQFNIHGNECRVIGSSPHDNGSAQAVLGVMEEFRADIAILGERNHNDFEEMRLQKGKYENKPKLYEGNDNIFAKKLYTRFFKNQMPKDLGYYLHPEDGVVYYADQRNKRILVDDYITAAHHVHKTMETGLLFGKPETTLHLEDIVLRFGLVDLQKMFFQSIDTTKDRFQNANAYPFADNGVILTALREVTKELHKDTLYGKALVYQASLLKQSSRNYKKSLLITNNLFPEQIEQLTLEPALPEITEIFRTYLQAEKREKDLTSTIDEAWKKDFDKEKIRETIEMSKNRFNFFRKERKLYENIGNLNPEEVMEKFVIVNQLIDNEMRMFLNHGQNPFELTIFADLFKDYSTQDLYNLYMRINGKYSMVLHHLQNTEIQRIATYTETAGRRKQIPYDEAVKEIDDRKEKLGYKLRIGFVQQAKQTMMINSLIMKQIQKNIDRRIAEGQSQTEILLHLQKVKEGFPDPRSREVFQELMVEANAQLKLLKLPPKFRRYMGFIREINVKTFESVAEKSLDQITEDLVAAQSPFRKTIPSDVFNEDGTETKVKKMNEKQREKLIRKLAELGEDEGAVKRRELLDKIMPQSNQGHKLNTESLINSMILGDDQPFPFDINKMSVEELREAGAEIITDFNFKVKSDGSYDIQDLQEDQKEKLKKIGEILKEVENDDNEDAEPLFSEDEEVNDLMRNVSQRRRQ